MRSGISAIRIRPVSLPLRAPFVISAGRQVVHEGVLFGITTAGRTGWGEASPSERVTGETRATVLTALRRFAMDSLAASRRRARLLVATAGSAAMAAIDIAAHDLSARREGVPLWRSLGGRRREIATSLTISVGPPGPAVEAARQAVAQGAGILKVKIGTDPRQDLARLRAIHAALPHVRLRADANAGYSLAAAHRFLDGVGELPLEFVEEPLRRSMPAAVRELADHGVPFLLDESVQTARDVSSAARQDGVTGVNVKLMKVGGIGPASDLVDRAHEAGLRVMIGCMIETGVGIAAGLAVALGRGTAFADLDGHLFLRQDVLSAPGIPFHRGILRAPRGDGLGIRLRS